MISKRDSKPFLIKFPIGVSKTSKKEMIYQNNWQIVYGLVGDPSGRFASTVYGKEQNFDKMITLNAGSLSRQINSNTVFLLDNMPTDNYSKGDYSVSYIFPEYNGEIVIGLTKRQSISLPKLYFFTEMEQPLYFQLNFDSNEKVAYVSENEFLPIGMNQSVWESEPKSEDDANSRLIFKSKAKVGFTNNHKPFYKLTFEVE